MHAVDRCAREHDLLGERDVPADALWRHPHAAGAGELPARRAAGPSRAGPRLRRGQAGLRAHEPRARAAGTSRAPAAIEAACEEMIDGRARRARRRRRPAGRRRHLDQHERQRGAGQPAPCNCSARPLGRLRRDLARSTTSTCTSRPTTPIPRRCKVAAIRRCASWSGEVVALQEAFQRKEKAVRRRRQGRPHRSCRTPCSPRSAARWAPTPRPSAATAGGSTSARSGCASSTSAARPSARARRAAAVHLPRRRAPARDHRPRPGPRREPGRGDAERRRLRRGQRHPQGAAPSTC